MRVVIGIVVLAACGSGASSLKQAGEQCTASAECESGLLCDLAQTPAVCAASSSLDAPALDAPADTPSDAMVDAMLTPAQLTATPQVDFGDVPIVTTQKRTVMVQNIGQQSSSPIALSLVENPADGGLALVPGVTDTCSGVMLGGGAQCAFEISFTPQAVQDYGATVTTAATTGGSPTTTVTGKGVSE